MQRDINKRLHTRRCALLAMALLTMGALRAMGALRDMGGLRAMEALRTMGTLPATGAPQAMVIAALRTAGHSRSERWPLGLAPLEQSSQRRGCCVGQRRRTP